jgi:Ca2+:H+ antiporter
MPLAAAGLYAAYAAGLIALSGAVMMIIVAFLAGAIFAAVHHAEIIAAPIGEPYGSIVLAVVVTVIELGLILSLMFAAPDGGVTIARDTVYAAVMIILTGVIGLSLMAGGRRHHEQITRVRGTSSALSVLGALVALALVLPNFTVSQSGPVYSDFQLAMAAVLSIVLYAAFLFTQTVSHRDYFLTEAVEGEPAAEDSARPATRTVIESLILLLVALAGVVLLAKSLSGPLNALIRDAGLPPTFTGVVIAALVLLPESIAAVRAAIRNRTQTSLNLALGSALASIGLTIPAVAVVSFVQDLDLQLGVTPLQTALLAIALFVSTLTLGTGRTNFLHGVVHTVLFVTFLTLSAFP